MKSDILSLTVEDMADRLRQASAAAEAAQGMCLESRSSDALQLLVEHMLPLQEALTMIKLATLQALIAARRD